MDCCRRKQTRQSAAACPAGRGRCDVLQCLAGHDRHGSRAEHPSSQRLGDKNDTPGRSCGLPAKVLC